MEQYLELIYKLLLQFQIEHSFDTDIRTLNSIKDLYNKVFNFVINGNSCKFTECEEVLIEEITRYLYNDYQFNLLRGTPKEIIYSEQLKEFIEYLDIIKK